MQTDIIDNTNLIIIENSKMDQALQFHQKLSKIPNFNLNIRFPLNRTLILNNDTPNESIYSLDIFVNLAVIIPRNYNAQNFEKDYKIITLFLIKSIKLLNIDFTIVNAIGYKIYSYIPQTFSGTKVTKTLFNDLIPFDSLETIKTLQFDSNFNLILSIPSTFSNQTPFSNNINTQSFIPSSQPFGSNPFLSSNVLNNQQPYIFNAFNPNTTFGANTTQPNTTFGANNTQPNTTFGANTTQSNTTFGANNTQQGTTFGSNNTQPNTTFGTNTTQPGATFGANNTQPNTTFGTNTTQQGTTFGANNTQSGTSFNPSFGANPFIFKP